MGDADRPQPASRSAKLLNDVRVCGVPIEDVVPGTDTNGDFGLSIGLLRNGLKRDLDQLIWDTDNTVDRPVDRVHRALLPAFLLENIFLKQA